MKNTSGYLCLILGGLGSGFLLPNSCFGQQSVAAPQATMAIEPSEKPRPSDLKVNWYNTKLKIHLFRLDSLTSLGLSVGTGSLPAIDVVHQIHPLFALRAEYAYLSYRFDVTRDVKTYEYAGIIQTMKGKLNANIQMSRIGLLLEYLAVPSGKVRLIAGVAYFPNKTLKLGASLDGFPLGDLKLTPDDIGYGTISFAFDRQLSPYLGFGLGRLIPKKRWNVSFDAGAYYLGNWRVTTIEVKEGIILDEIRKNAPIVQRNLNLDTRNKLLPSVNFRIGYRLF
jgi:hypothetical protein